MSRFPELKTQREIDIEEWFDTVGARALRGFRWSVRLFIAFILVAGLFTALGN
jgi:hypothetical protein